MARPVDQARPEAARLGSYEIVRKLARGGMAELYLARTVGPGGFEKLVVLKRILPTHANNPKFVRLFLDEARLAATLDHPNIAHVYDMGRADGHYFFAMEYVHGHDVRKIMRRAQKLGRSIPIAHVVQIGRDVAAALHYAHERKSPEGTLLDIVHRDVSPSNILLSFDGAVKLVDFGVAKTAASTVKTRTGALKGKIAYMSPEQAKGAPIDRRSDIFSLGIVLWEMLTGERLFKAENDLATIQKIINSKPPPPSRRRPDCPPPLEQIVLRALESSVDDRYQTAEQLVLDLEALARDHQLMASTGALRAFMHDLFADDVQAWSAAQASGQTLAEHVIERATMMTTPLGESDIESSDDYHYELDPELDDEEDEDQPSDTVPPTTQHDLPTQNDLPAQLDVPTQNDLPAQHELPTQVLPTIASEDAPTMQFSGSLLAQAALDEAIRAASTPFPIAPPEWRPGQNEPAVEDPHREQRIKRILIGSSIAFAVLVLLVIAFAVSDPTPAAATTDDAGAPTRIEMKAVPSTPPGT